jgi:hypothetical protein
MDLESAHQNGDQSAELTPPINNNNNATDMYDQLNVLKKASLFGKL